MAPSLAALISSSSSLLHALATQENSMEGQKTSDHAAATTEYDTIGDGSVPAEEETEKHARTPTPPKLGAGAIFLLAVTVIGYTAGILGAVAYLTFLWFASTSSTWKVIVLSNWTATSVAICALAIRWLSGLQTVLSTSILAWTYLRRGVPVSNIPRISTFRYSNDGPLELFRILMIGGKRGLHLHLLGIAALSASIAVILQFSSTLLLSDLATVQVETFSEFYQSAVYQDSDTDPLFAAFYNDIFLSTSPRYPLFAEDVDENRAPPRANVDDTGPVIRAFLPLDSEANTSALLSFEGNATVYDARWICAPPSLSNLKLNMSLYAGTFEGVANYSTPIPAIVSPKPPDSWRFICPITEGGSDASWTLFLCQVQQNGTTGMVDSLGTLYQPGYEDFLSGVVFVLVNVTNLTSTYLTLSGPSNPRPYCTYDLNFNDSDMWQTQIESSSSWTHAHSEQEDAITCLLNGDANKTEPWPRGQWTFALDVSLCANAVSEMPIMHVSAKRSKAVQEPSTENGGMIQIGASGSDLTPEERGIMSLNVTGLDKQVPLSNRRYYAGGGFSHLVRYSWLEFVHPLDTRRNGLSFSLFGALSEVVKDLKNSVNSDYSNTFKTLHEDLVAIMQRVLKGTGSPARALQALQHVYMASLYSRSQPYLTGQVSSNVTYAKGAIRPVRSRGYTVVMTALGVHFLLFSFILIVFGVLPGTLLTLASIDQAWQVFTQVSLLLRDLSLDEEGGYSEHIGSTTATDRMVEKDLKRRGLEDKVFVLDDAKGDGALRFRGKND